MVTPAEPRAGDVVRYELRVVNRGGDSGVARVSSELPLAYPIDFADGCEGATPDRETRHVVWYEGPIAAGEVKTCTVRLLSRRDDAGSRLSVDTEVSAFRPDSYWRFSAGVTLDSRTDLHRMALGPIFVSRAGAFVLVLLGLLVTGLFGLGLVAGSRSGTLLSHLRRAFSVCVVCVGFLCMFAGLAYDDYRAATSYRESRCEVFYRDLAPEEMAVRYAVDGVPTFSAGFGTATRLTVGVPRSPSASLDAFRVGTTHPCWYDPDDVTTVLLDRSPGGAYLFALLPLGVLGYAGVLLAGLWRQR